jgi:hypothetical protein
MVIKVAQWYIVQVSTSALLSINYNDDPMNTSASLSTLAGIKKYSGKLFKKMQQHLIATPALQSKYQPAL